MFIENDKKKSKLSKKTQCILIEFEGCCLDE